MFSPLSIHNARLKLMLITFNLDNQIMYPLHHVSDYISGSGPHCFRTKKDCLNQREREREREAPPTNFFHYRFLNLRKKHYLPFSEFCPSYLLSAFIRLPIAIIRSAKAGSMAESGFLGFVTENDFREMHSYRLIMLA